jgi:hypothetical protein
VLFLLFPGKPSSLVLRFGGWHRSGDCCPKKIVFSGDKNSCHLRYMRSLREYTLRGEGEEHTLLSQPSVISIFNAVQHVKFIDYRLVEVGVLRKSKVFLAFRMAKMQKFLEV